MDGRVMVMFTKGFMWRRGHKQSFTVIMRLCTTIKAASLLSDVTDAQNVSGNIKSMIIRSECRDDGCD